jgi:hypothetical protein
MNHLPVHQIVHAFEVRNVQRADGLDGQREGLIGAAGHAALWQALSRSPQGAKNLCPIEALTFTMIAEAHGAVPPFDKDRPRFNSRQAVIRRDSSCRLAAGRLVAHPRPCAAVST